eukprot:GHVS01082787.1.p1 GENE.GHVS01082787.1~~GHVS01082787.1.p1  ORF type:complete len:816 (+),score=82.29 GHVS01082787.1:312-2450(+)
MQALARLDEAVEVKRADRTHTPASYNREWDSYLKCGILDMEMERCAQINNAAAYLDTYEAVPATLLGAVKAGRRAHRARLVTAVSRSSVLSYFAAGGLFVLRPLDELTSQIVSSSQNIHGDMFDYSGVVIPVSSGGQRVEGNVWLSCSMCYSRFPVPNMSLDSEHKHVTCPSCGSSKDSPVSGMSPLPDVCPRVSYRFWRRTEGWLGVLAKVTVRGDSKFITVDLYPLLDNPQWSDDAFLRAQEFRSSEGRLPAFHATAADPFSVGPASKSYWLTPVAHPKHVYDRRMQALEAFCDPTVKPCSERIRELVIPTSNPVPPLLAANERPVKPMAHKLESSLTEAQKKAVEAAVGRQDPVCLIQGPPGTGKTRVAASIITEWAMDPYDTSPISASAGTHVAVEALRTRLAERGIACETLSDDTGWRDATLQKRLAAFPHEFPPSSKQTSTVFLDTVFQACKLRHLQRRCSRMLIDESSNMLEYSALIPVTQGCQQLVLIGDQQQLAPMFSKRTATISSPISLFERLTRNPSVPDRLFLDTQFRMPYPLCDFSSAEFYDGALISDKAMLASKSAMALPSGMPWPVVTAVQAGDVPRLREGSEMPLLFIDTDYGTDHKQYEQRVCRSLHNPVEVEIVARVVESLVTGGAQREQIAVLTPYTGHRRLLKKRIHHQDEREQVVQRSFLRGVRDLFCGYTRPVGDLCRCHQRRMSHLLLQ